MGLSQVLPRDRKALQANPVKVAVVALRSHDLRGWSVPAVQKPAGAAARVRAPSRLDSDFARCFTQRAVGKRCEHLLS